MKSRTIRLAAAFQFLCSILLLMQFGCQKQLQPDPTRVVPSPPVSQSDMSVCHNNSAWDSAQIHNKLLGRWEWEFIECYWNPEDANNTDFKGLMLNFNTDSTVLVTDSSGNIQTSCWQLQATNSGYWIMRTTPLVYQLPGRVLFCGERVLFSDTYVDGCNNYFKKLN